MAVVYVQLPHGAAAGTRRARWRRGVCFPELIANPREAQMAVPAIALDVGHTRDLVSMVHVALKHAIRRAQEHAAMFAGRWHFL